MSVIIVFPDDSDWYVTGWEFHRLLRRCKALFPEDTSMHKDLDRIYTYDFIKLGAEEPRTKEILASLQKIAERTIAEVTQGESPLFPQDPGGRQDTLRVYNDLLISVKRATATERPGGTGNS